MKSSRLLLLALSVVVLVSSGLSAAVGVGTTFSYQGQLREAGLPANGTYNVDFKLFDASAGGIQYGDTLTWPALPVFNGQFTVELNFGNVFGNHARWLEITVNGTTLSPRQNVRPVPFSISATYAMMSYAAAPSSVTSDMLAIDAPSLGKMTGSVINVSSGKVGIGTSTPLANLDVMGSTPNDLKVFIRNSNTAGTEALYFGTDTASGAGMILSGSTSPVTPGLWRFFNNKTGGSYDWIAGGSIRMTLTSAGRLGIGTSSPDEPLSVNGALKVDQANTNNGTMDIKFGAGATGEGIGSKRTAGGNSNGLDFFTNSASRLNITNTGTVGASGKLHVNQGHVASDTAPSLVFGNAGSLEGIGSTRYAGDNTDGLDFYTGGNKRLSITNAGSLQVRDSTGLGIAFSGNGETGADTGIGHPSDGMLTFWNNGSEAMCIKTGSVGVGTLTPVSKLHVDGGHSGSMNSSGLITAINQSTDYADRVGVFGKTAVQPNYGIGVLGIGGYTGVRGESAGTTAGSYYAMRAYSSAPVGSWCYGMYGQAQGSGTNYGVFGQASGGTTNYAGYFQGNVHVTGTLSKAGGSFKIDHPLDPENKYLSHSFVESPDMMNIYNGNVTTGDDGLAAVTLPDWFGSLNKDFRYQLTVIGQFAQAIVAEEIQGNQFVIQTDKPGVKVSWQVTGVRQDAWADANRIVVEENKDEVEKGTYLHPAAFGQPEDRGIAFKHQQGRDGGERK